MPVFNEQNQIMVKCLENELDKDEFELWNYLSRNALDTLCGKSKHKYAHKFFQWVSFRHGYGG